MPKPLCTKRTAFTMLAAGMYRPTAWAAATAPAGAIIAGRRNTVFLINALSPQSCSERT